MDRALPAAENLSQLLKITGFVKGHDFSRADKANKINGDLAPAKVKAQEIDRELPFSAAF